MSCPMRIAMGSYLKTDLGSNWVGTISSYGNGHGMYYPLAAQAQSAAHACVRRSETTRAGAAQLGLAGCCMVGNWHKTSAMMEVLPTSCVRGRPLGP